MQTFRRTARLVLALLLAIALRAQDLKEFEKRVTEFTLANGMHFIVLERHDAPVVSSGGRGFPVEVRHLGDGEERIQPGALRGPGGRFLEARGGMIVTFIRDISERKRAEQARGDCEACGEFSYAFHYTRPKDSNILSER